MGQVGQLETLIPSTTSSAIIKKARETRNSKSQPNETIPNVSSEILPEEGDKDVTDSESNSDLNLNTDLTRDLEQNETSAITSTKPPRPSKSIQLESTEKIDERVEAGISLKEAEAGNQRIDRINPADGESELLRPRHEAQMAPTSTPLTFTVTATRPPLLIKPSIPPTPVLKKSSSSSSTSSSSFTTVTTTTVVPRSSSPVREHDNQQHSTTAATTTTTTSSSSLSSSPSSPPSSSSAPQSSMNDGSSEPTIMTFPEDINNLSSAMDNPEQSDTNADNEKHSDITTSALLSSTIDTQNLPSSDLKTSLQSSTIIPTTTTDTPAEYPFIYPPLKTTTMRLEPVTLEFIYNRHTPPPSSTTSTTTTPQAITTMTSASTVTRSSTRGTTRTMNPAVRPPKPVPSYNVVRTTVATATKRRGTGGTAQQQDNPPVRTSTSVQHKPPPVLIIDRPGSGGSNSVAASGSGSNITGRGVTLPGVIVTSMSPAGPTGAPIASGVMMGLGSGAEIGIAAGSIVAFWLLLGPLVCIICRLRERAAAKSRGAGSSNQTERCLHDDGTGTIGTNGIAGDEEMGTRLVEEMIRMELARGRHKLYKTNVQDEHETQRLGDLSLNGGDYVNTEFLHPHIVQNDYAKNSMDRNNSCEKIPLSNGTLTEPLYANTLKVDRADRVPPPPPPPPPQNIDPLYANGIASSPLPPRPPPPPSSNGYVCSNNYPLSSAALYLAKSRPGPRIPPPPQSIRSPESEPVDGFMYSPRLLQRQLERAVRTEQKKEGGLRRSEKIFPVPDKFSNIHCEPKRNTPKYAVPEKKIEPAKKVEPIYAEPIRAEPKCHKKAGLINGYSKLPTHLPQASINTGHVGIPESPRIMPKHIQEEDEYEDDEFDELDLDDDGSLSRTPSPPASQRTRDIPKSLSLSQSVERAIPLLLNGEKYRITSSNPSIDSGKYIINKGMSKSMERSNGLLPNIDKSSPLERNNGLLHHNTDQKNSPLDSAKSPLNGDCVLSPMNPEADPWKPRVKNNTKTVLNGKGPYRSRNSVEDSPISSSSSSPPKEIVPEINHDVQCKKQLCDQGTQTLVDTIKSPWIGYRRPGVKDTVV